MVPHVNVSDARRILNEKKEDNFERNGKWQNRVVKQSCEIVIVVEHLSLELALARRKDKRQQIEGEEMGGEKVGQRRRN